MLYYLTVVFEKEYPLIVLVILEIRVELNCTSKTNKNVCIPALASIVYTITEVAHRR